MGDRNTEYVLVKSRKPKKTRQHYYNDDEDEDEDDDPEFYRRLPRRKPRVRYVSNEDDDYDRHRRRQPSDVCVMN